MHSYDKQFTYKSLSLQSVFLYQLQLHSQSDYTIVIVQKDFNTDSSKFIANNVCNLRKYSYP